MTIVYSATRQQANQAQSLVDRGANAGTDVRVIHKYHRKVTVQGIDNHQVNDVSIGDVGGVVNTQFGPVIAIGCLCPFRLWAYYSLTTTDGSIRNASR